MYSAADSPRPHHTVEEAGGLAGAPEVYSAALQAVRDVGDSDRMGELDDLPSGSQSTLQ